MKTGKIYQYIVESENPKAVWESPLLNSWNISDSINKDDLVIFLKDRTILEEITYIKVLTPNGKIGWIVYCSEDWIEFIDL